MSLLRVEFGNVIHERRFKEKYGHWLELCHNCDITKHMHPLVEMEPVCLYTPFPYTTIDTVIESATGSKGWETMLVVRVHPSVAGDTYCHTFNWNNLKRELDDLNVKMRLHRDGIYSDQGPSDIVSF